MWNIPAVEHDEEVGPSLEDLRFVSPKNTRRDYRLYALAPSQCAHGFMSGALGSSAAAHCALA